MKRKSILLFGIVLATLNSCVYSLFPIYTDDTLVFREELLGKWSMEDGEYLVFEKMAEESQFKEEKEEREHKYTIEIPEEGFTMSSDEPLFVLQNGRKIYDQDSIIMIMRERLKDDETEDGEIAEERTSDNVENRMDNITSKSSNLDFSGSVSVYEEKSYRLTIISKDEKKEVYVANLANIGGDIFMDLYPIKEFDSKNISDNFFPVHTFYKVRVTENEFTMIHFDLEKLNDLFESNLIRLRHENVEGTVLITAQPKEMQKFLDKYADDESVFDEVITYSKAI